MSYLVGENKMSYDLQRFHDMLSRQSNIEKEKILEFNKNNPPHTEIIIPSNEFDDEITVGMWFVDGAVWYGNKLKIGYDPHRLSIIPKEIILEIRKNLRQEKWKS